MNTEKEPVVGVCWFCGQLWKPGCPGERIGHRPVVMTGDELTNWQLSGKPPELMGFQVLLDWQWPLFSPVEAAFRRGFHHAICLVNDLFHRTKLKKHDLDVLEEIACEYRYDRQPRPYYTELVAAEWEKRRGGRKADDELTG